ncbi:hypothetical protein ONS96_005274 [Cadophora gregata f. sp. sojae]|nr:hypothetical protein ONS96_005274 [Cadophora gregata f. sp. sojae]
MIDTSAPVLSLSPSITHPRVRTSGGIERVLFPIENGGGIGTLPTTVGTNVPIPVSYQLTENRLLQISNTLETTLQQQTTSSASQVELNQLLIDALEKVGIKTPDFCPHIAVGRTSSLKVMPQYLMEGWRQANKEKFESFTSAIGVNTDFNYVHWQGSSVQILQTANRMGSPVLGFELTIWMLRQQPGTTVLVFVFGIDGLTTNIRSLVDFANCHRHLNIVLVFAIKPESIMEDRIGIRGDNIVYLVVEMSDLVRVNPISQVAKYIAERFPKISDAKMALTREETARRNVSFHIAGKALGSCPECGLRLRKRMWAHMCTHIDYVRQLLKRTKQDWFETNKPEEQRLCPFIGCLPGRAMGTSDEKFDPKRIAFAESGMVRRHIEEHHIDFFGATEEYQSGGWEVPWKGTLRGWHCEKCMDQGLISRAHKTEAGRDAHFKWFHHEDWLDMQVQKYHLTDYKSVDYVLELYDDVD